MILDGVKAAALLFAAALLQVTVLADISLAGGTPALPLVTLVALGLLRGSVLAATGGFFVGLIIDTATLQTLGVTSLLLTLAGYWVGRYGETTGRGRSHAPVLSALVLTVLYAFAELALRYVLGEPTSLRVAFDTLVPQIVLNMALVVPVFALCRRVLRPPVLADRAQEVRLLG